MIRIKSLRPCILVIPDADLTLLPGQVVEVPSLSPQTEKLITRGSLARLEAEPAADTASLPPQDQAAGNTLSEKAAAAYKEIAGMLAHDATEHVSEMTDPQILQEILNVEKRKTVMEAINQRLGELKK